MGKTDKNICYKRKVILLKYKDRKESLLLSKTIERTKEKLSIKVQYNTKKTRRSRNKYNLKEKYPVFKAQLKDRTVPRCLRAMCAEKNKYIRMPQQHTHKHREARQDLKHQMKRKRGVSLSSISSTEISDDLILDNGFEYDNISSGSLGSYTDDEIESLMKSTRKRMRDLDDDWTLFPRQHPPSPVSKTFDNTDVSINSLDTLVLEADDSKEYLDVYDLKNEAYSPTMSPEDSKYESLITNNNNIILEFKDTENLYKNHVQSDNVIDDKVIKKEEMGDFEYNYIPCYSAVNVNNNSIKQELCGDL